MKRIRLLCLLLAALLLCACSQRPPAALVEELPQEERVIPAEPEAEAAVQFTATLYFRYADTPLLRQEARDITIAPNESREKALVSALLEGAREPGSRALFPEKTRVLSAQAQDGVVYITFNEALYDRYADEDRAPAQSVQRRRLAMAALTATLTESGEYRGVQVLVRAEEKVSGSMRLQQRYFLTEEEGVVPPFTRWSDCLPTPGAYARELLSAWQARDWESLSLYLSARDDRGVRQAAEVLGREMALISFAIYDATTSLDGAAAVVCADLMFRTAAGEEIAMESCPLRLTRENGAWKAAAAQLQALMGEKDE